MPTRRWRREEQGGLELGDALQDQPISADEAFVPPTQKIGSERHPAGRSGNGEGVDGDVILVVLAVYDRAHVLAMSCWL